MKPFISNIADDWNFIVNDIFSNQFCINVHYFVRELSQPHIEQIQNKGITVITAQVNKEYVITVNSDAKSS